MRCLERNKEIVYYALYSGKTALTDDNGDATGEYTVSYGNIVKARCNVSPARLHSALEEFGILNSYSKMIVTDDVSTDFDTATVFWIGFGDVGAYSTETSYSVGSMVIYDGKMYLCKAITSGEFVPANWLEIPHNYAVVNVGKSYNSASIAVKEVSKL